MKIVGTSGATVEMFADSAWKTGPEGPVRDRVMLQGQWLSRMSSVCLPVVRKMYADGYKMERLLPLEWTADRRRGLVFCEARQKLRDWVWGDRQKVKAKSYLKADHENYVIDLCERIQPGMTSNVIAWLRHLRGWTVTAVEETHGDPTVDNMMQRSSGDLVMIDPIPHSTRMPALLAVDIGKMLQSAHGYEETKYGVPAPYDKALAVSAILADLSAGDIALAEYMHVVHVLRLIPYQPADLAARFVETLRAFRV